MGSDCYIITAVYSSLLCNVRVAALVRGDGACLLLVGKYKMVLREPPAAAVCPSYYHALPPLGPLATGLLAADRRRRSYDNNIII